MISWQMLFVFPALCLYFKAVANLRLLLPVACLAAMTNLLSFRIGPREFRAVLPTLEAGETASMSKKYIRASIGILLIFQIPDGR